MKFLCSVKASNMRNECLYYETSTINVSDYRQKNLHYIYCWLILFVAVILSVAREILHKQNLRNFFNWTEGPYLIGFISNRQGDTMILFEHNYTTSYIFIYNKSDSKTVGNAHSNTINNDIKLGGFAYATDEGFLSEFFILQKILI